MEYHSSCLKIDETRLTNHDCSPEIEVALWFENSPNALVDRLDIFIRRMS
jgi:hypothetical protein